jgi:hypothetical protein
MRALSLFVATSVAFGVLALAPAARAQKRETQAWSALFFTVRDPSNPKAKEGFSGWLDLQARRGPDGTNALIRPGLGYRASPNLSYWAGYAFIGTYNDGKPNVYEHRAWQQMTYASSVGPLSLQVRGRVEERFRANESAALRVRLFGRANVALWNESPLAVATWNEVFVQLHETTWGAPGGFDQNRLFLGLGYTAGAMRLEGGYLTVVQRRKDESLLHQQNVGLMGYFAF